MLVNCINQKVCICQKKKMQQIKKIQNKKSKSYVILSWLWNLIIFHIGFNSNLEYHLPESDGVFYKLTLYFISDLCGTSFFQYIILNDNFKTFNYNTSLIGKQRR